MVWPGGHNIGTGYGLARHGKVYCMAWQCMAWCMIWPGGHGMIYGMAWRPWHGICYGLVGITWYMLWPGEVCHGMWKVIELHALRHCYGL